MGQKFRFFGAKKNFEKQKNGDWGLSGDWGIGSKCRPMSITIPNP